MILVIGSEASGKKEYVRSLGYTEDQFGSLITDDRPVLYGLHNIVAADPAAFKSQLAALESGEDIKKSGSALQPLLDKEVIICNEVGSGIIPMLPDERMAREQTGRLCILLAKHAEHVVRLVCGIPVTIK